MERKKALITGGSHGIGRGIAQVLAESGYDVAVTYNNRKDDALSLQQELEAIGARCLCYQASLDKAGVPEEVTALAARELGGLDLLVCNAGQTKHNDLLNLQQDLIDFLYALNYRAYLMCAKVAANDMVSRGVKGNIIFIASTRGIRAYPEDSIYGSLKAALIRATESIALDMAKHDIRVNCIAPGFTAISGDFSPESLRSHRFVQKIPLKRMGSPREVGYLARFIASDEAGYMTGNTIKLDGGLILPGIPEKEQ